MTTLLYIIYSVMAVGAFVTFLGICALVGELAETAETIEESDEIMRERMFNDQQAMIAARLNNFEQVEKIEARADLLETCVELLYPGKNDDSARWKPGGKEKYQQCET